MSLQQSRFFIAASIVPVLLLLAGVCHAEVLYKWREADGTLTFSPEPPTDSGIEFEKVSSSQGLAPMLKSAAASAPQENPLELNQSLTQNTASEQVSNVVQRPQNDAPPAQSAQKSVHCKELQKRVVSLERLLQTDISNETMDNAVVQMARYQASFNQACNRLNLR